jgi:hypothetical protein
MAYVSRLLFLAPVLVTVLHGATLIDFLDPTKFGNLDQHLVDSCKDSIGNSLSCGPSAAVNSFVFLENMYPGVYGNSLVDLSGLFTKVQAEVMAANDLSSFMGCTPCSGGTTFSNFVSGKESYINLLAPGTTYYDVMRIPSAEFIDSELAADEDIETLINFPDPNFSGHYVTITGITYDTVLEMGYLSYIDPADGKLHSAPIHGGGATPGIFIDYFDPSTGLEHDGGELTGAVAESPVPEPATILLAAAVLFLVAISQVQRRHFGKHRACGDLEARII